MSTSNGATSGGSSATGVSSNTGSVPITSNTTTNAIAALINALTNARTQIHSFKVKVVEDALADGEKVVEEVQGKADGALKQYQYRRYWLAVTLLPILMVIGLLVLYIRALPIPQKPADLEDENQSSV